MSDFSLFFFFFFNQGRKSQEEKIKEYELPTFSCCWSSLLSRANTVFVSLFLLIEAWIAFLSFPTDLKTQTHTRLVTHDTKVVLNSPFNQPSCLPGDGGLSGQDSSYNVWFLWTVLLVLRSELVFRLQPSAYRFRRRGEGTGRTFRLMEKNRRKSTKTLIQLLLLFVRKCLYVVSAR